MSKMRSLDYELLWELIKDSRRSDRQLAKALNSSQPTVTRKRMKLEKEALSGYTALPKWNEIGFELVAFTFIKSRAKYGRDKERERALKSTKEWLTGQPNVIVALSGQGMGWDGLCVSMHKSYSDYADFMRRHDMALSDYIIESQSFIADISPGLVMKPFHFKYLAKAGEQESKKEKQVKF
jgi:DNA-binding Lrp family transcriptional regulator